MTPRSGRAMAAVIGMLLASCGGGGSNNNNEFNAGVAKSTLESRPVKLEAEQVSLTTAQLECGLREELWETPVHTSDQRSTARLTSRGRDLKFFDDVIIGETGYKQPYVQVRGEYPIKVTEVVSVQDSTSPRTKEVEAKAGVVIQHSCFSSPLPVMGVRHGKFSENANPLFQLVLEGETWRVERIRH